MFWPMIKGHLPENYTNEAEPSHVSTQSSSFLLLFSKLVSMGFCRRGKSFVVDSALARGEFSIFSNSHCDRVPFPATQVSEWSQSPQQECSGSRM